MKSILLMLMAFALGGQAAPAKPTATVQLWRLDCGSLVDQDVGMFSDTMRFDGDHRTLRVSCYLIRHGDDYLLWDTGLPLSFRGAVPKPPYGETLGTTITDQLATIGVDPRQVKRVAVSHYHFDHTGQLASFPDATLLIGSGDLTALRGATVPVGANPGLLSHWLKGPGKILPVDRDLDIFGDGSVVMLDLRGHTPGHHGLLVRLPRTGPVLLSGDVTHFADNYAVDGVPTFNTDRAESLASLDRFKKIAAAVKAKVIIGHEPADIAKLPAFPKAAE